MRGLRSEQPHPCQQQGLCTLPAGPVTMLAAPQAEEIQGPGLMEGCEQGRSSPTPRIPGVHCRSTGAYRAASHQAESS